MRRGVGSLPLLVLLAALSGRAAGADPAPAADARRTASLKTRAREWCDVRKRVVHRCATCNGLGKLTKTRGGSANAAPEEDCPDCVLGARVNPEDARKAWFDVHTPAWRANPENAAAFETSLAAARADPAPHLLRDAVVRDARLRGARCGDVMISETGADGGPNPKVYAWVLGQERPGGPASWFLYDATADGDCDEPLPEPSPPPPQPPAPPTPSPSAPSAPGATAAVVADALRWLSAHQSPSGAWEAEGFPRWCDGQPATAATPSPGTGRAQYDVGVTGLALLAFIRGGWTGKPDGPYAKPVADGLAWLVKSQDAEGCFGKRSTGHFVYNHAIAARAVVEAYGKARSETLKAPAQKALDFIAIARNPYFAWRYGVKPGDNDTSVTGSMMRAIGSAGAVDEDDRRAGRPPTFALDTDAFEGAKSLIEKMTDPESGRVGYHARGSGPMRPAELVDRFPPERSEAMTAVGMLVRILIGQDPKREEMILKGAKLCEKALPTWNPNDGSIDMYYWYFATPALKRVGGAVWRTWAAAMRTAAEAGQVKAGDVCGTRGSWDPLDPWGADGGRVYSTAMMALCLEDCAE